MPMKWGKGCNVIEIDRNRATGGLIRTALPISAKFCLT